MAYECKIIADSIASNGVRLTTFQVCFPRFILAEFNTHRTLSRNSASSRAIPVKKRIQQVLEDPFVPARFPQNEKGMQASEYYEVGSAEHDLARSNWLYALNGCVSAVKRLSGIDPLSHVREGLSPIPIAALNVHKQIASRLLEPWLWHTVVVTATEWSNFFALRCHKDAQPEFQIIARMMREVYKERKPKPHPMNTVHCPYLQDEDLKILGQKFGGLQANELGKRVSVARCARVSYLTQDGKRDVEEDLKLFDRLTVREDPTEPRHMSPLEHVATAMGEDDAHIWSGNFRGWRQWRKEFSHESL